MAIPATQIRRGMVIVFEGQPCKVVEFRHHTPGNLRAMVQTKLKNIRTGSSFEHRFRSADTVDRASLEQHEMEFLYSDGSHYHFMNTETYEQTDIAADRPRRRHRGPGNAGCAGTSGRRYRRPRRHRHRIPAAWNRSVSTQVGCGVRGAGDW